MSNANDLADVLARVEGRFLTEKVESQKQDRFIRKDFFETYKKLIYFWIFFVVTCLVAEAVSTFIYDIELFPGALLKWIAGPISVGLFGGALAQHVFYSRQ